VKKNKVFLLISILALVILFGTAVTCNMCGLGSTSTTTTDTAAGSTISKETSKETISETTKDTSESATNATATETQEETAAATEKTEVPTIKLEIYEGPTYSAPEDICYYRVKATVTGSPAPKVTFSKDDSNGAWGSKKVQVNLTKSNPSYTLTAKAKNSAGESTASLTLNWGCNRNPVIDDITLSSSTIEINKIYAVTADVTDPDGDTLTYNWTVSSGGGSINLDTSNPMKWTTPAAAGDYSIQVKVKDGKGGEATESKTVSVNLPAALNMTVPKITSEGGWLEQNGLIHNSGESFYAGDSDSNKACRAYISFDITGLAGATINSAAITGIIKTKWGDPSVLDKMWIGIVDWGVHPIILQDFDLTGTPVQSLSTAGDGNFTCNIDALKTQLQNAITAGKIRFQVRIHMSVPGNSNNAWDGFEYKQSEVNLAVNYTK
jgi:hypothetical protein